MSEMMIHFLKGGDTSTPCDIPYVLGLANSAIWSEVTCAACKVASTHLLAARAAGRREQMIEECERVEAAGLAAIEALHVEVERAARLKHRLMRLSGRVAAQNASWVRDVSPQGFLSDLAAFAQHQRVGRPVWTQPGDWGDKPHPY